MEMIAAYIYKKIGKNIQEATGIVSQEMPNADFILEGVTDEHIYFSVVAKFSDITEEEQEDIKVKTRFQFLERTGKVIYSERFRMGIM